MLSINCSYTPRFAESTANKNSQHPQTKKKIYVWKKPEPTNLHQEETAGQKKKGKYRNDNIPPHTNMSTETHRQRGYTVITNDTSTVSFSYHNPSIPPRVTRTWDKLMIRGRNKQTNKKV
jgi:hypothetical protein